MSVTQQNRRKLLTLQKGNDSVNYGYRAWCNVLSVTDRNDNKTAITVSKKDVYHFVLYYQDHLYSYYFFGVLFLLTKKERKGFDQ